MTAKELVILEEFTNGGLYFLSKEQKKDNFLLWYASSNETQEGDT